ncbi:MAG: murein peptide amidase A [Desulfobacterales bacterium]|nr:murein peptide amidase A [Desulfobacterales bacterium]
MRRYKVGTSIENRPVVSVVIGQGKEVILVIATVHGNERAGTRLVRQLPGYFRRYPKLLRGRKVIVLPLANPDGAVRNCHYNSRGVDLNHNFSTANRINSMQYGFTGLSEPETRVIERIIRYYSPRRIISFHQPLACIDYDGPGRNLAHHIAKFCDLPVCKLGALPGSLGSYAGVELGIPTITFELPWGADMLTSENLWGRYGASLIAAILYNARLQIHP